MIEKKNSGSGSGGFLLPCIFHKKQKEIIEEIYEGNIDYIGKSNWQFLDEFFAYLLQSGFFKFIDETYPNPREKNEVPIWFLISCQLVLRIFGGTSYLQLRHFLNAGPLISKLGFNVGTNPTGFNKKNKFTREIPLHQDTVRKFFKDTTSTKMREWYNKQLQTWFVSKRALDNKGIFILDQTHLVVPDNPNYKKAVRMPVDEFGQLYPNYSKLTSDQKSVLIHHPCYTLSCLINIPSSKDRFHISSYDWGSGNEDELVQSKKIIDNFANRNPGVIKELIMDRGYLDGEWLGQIKIDYDIDTLVPLKKNMNNYLDAIEIAKKNLWETVEQKTDSNGNIIYQLLGTCIGEMKLWESNPCPQYVYVIKKRWLDKLTGKYKEKVWALTSTRKYSVEKAVKRYRLRVSIEERYRQFKYGWNLSNFPSPDENLMEAHIAFTVASYSLVQLYLSKQQLQEQTQRFIQTLQFGKDTGKGACVVYSGDGFATISLEELLYIAMKAPERARTKLLDLLERQMKVSPVK